MLNKVENKRKYFFYFCKLYFLGILFHIHSTLFVNKYGTVLKTYVYRDSNSEEFPKAEHFLPSHFSFKSFFTAYITHVYSNIFIYNTILLYDIPSSHNYFVKNI